MKIKFRNLETGEVTEFETDEHGWLIGELPPGSFDVEFPGTDMPDMPLHMVHGVPTVPYPGTLWEDMKAEAHKPAPEAYRPSVGMYLLVILLMLAGFFLTVYVVVTWPLTIPFLVMGMLIYVMLRKKEK